MPITTTVNENFEKWLHGDEYKPFTYQERGSFYTYLKVPRDEHFDYLYQQCSYHGTALERNHGFEYAGIYCKQDGLIYDAYRNFHSIAPELESPKSKNELEQDMTDHVRAIIDSTVGNDRNNLTSRRLEDFEKDADLIYYKQHRVHEIARKAFLAGDTVDDIVFHSEYEYRGWSEDDFLDYIRDGKRFEQNEADKYMATHQDDMLFQFLRNDLLINELTVIEANPNNTLHRIKAIMNAVNGVPDARTVTVSVETPKASMSFKTQANDLRRDPVTTYSTWNISASDRSIFEQLFGRSYSYSPDDIVRIDYGKKTLYEAAPAYLFAEKNQETDEDSEQSDDESEDTDIGMTM